MKTIEERIQRLEKAILEIAVLLDRVQWSASTRHSVHWGEGTAVAEIRLEDESGEALVVEKKK